MKVLYVDTPLDPPGGGQISLLNILKNAPWESVVCIPRAMIGGKFHNTLLSDTYKGKVMVFPSDIFHLPRVIKNVSPDIVHSNSAATRYTFIAALASRLLNIPFVWHNRVIESAPLREKIIGWLSDRIVVISDAVGSKFNSSAMRKKMIKIYNAVDSNEFAPHRYDIETRNRILKDIGLTTIPKKIIGVFSRLEGWKGHSLFLRALARIFTDNGAVDFCALIVGEGRDAAGIRSFAAVLGLSDKVIFTGYQQDIPRLMNLCDVIVNPSCEPEPFGRSIIEAMSCGKPVIATDGGGPREIISDGVDGMLVKPDPDCLQKAIIKVISDEKLAKNLGDAARQKVLNFFTVQKQIVEISKLYNELVENLYE